MARKAPEIKLTEDEYNRLKVIVTKSISEQRMVLRARIILLAGQGYRNDQIMEKLAVSKPVVVKWRRRFFQHRLEGLKDAPRPGKPRIYGPEVSFPRSKSVFPAFERHLSCLYVRSFFVIKCDLIG